MVFKEEGVVSVFSERGGGEELLACSFFGSKIEHNDFCTYNCSCQRRGSINGLWKVWTRRCMRDGFLRPVFYEVFASVLSWILDEFTFQGALALALAGGGLEVRFLPRRTNLDDCKLSFAKRQQWWQWLCFLELLFSCYQQWSTTRTRYSIECAQENTTLGGRQLNYRHLI